MVTGYRSPVLPDVNFILLRNAHCPMIYLSYRCVASGGRVLSGKVNSLSFRLALKSGHLLLAYGQH